MVMVMMIELVLHGWGAQEANRKTSLWSMRTPEKGHEHIILPNLNLKLAWAYQRRIQIQILTKHRRRQLYMVIHVTPLHTRYNLVIFNFPKCCLLISGPMFLLLLFTSLVTKYKRIGHKSSLNCFELTRICQIIQYFQKCVRLEALVRVR